MEALISQHPTRVLLLYPTNLHHNRQKPFSKCTPINLMKALLAPPKLRPPLLTLYWQRSINPFTPLMMMLQTSAMSFQSRGLTRFRSANDTSSSMPITPAKNWSTVVQMEALLVQICVPSIKPTARLTFKALITMKLLVLMWLLLQPSSTPLTEKSLAYSMNMPTLERAHPFIHQVNLNGLRPMLMKNLSKLVVPNLSLLWMAILSLSSSRMVWPMPPLLENPQIRTWTHIHMSFSPLLMNEIPQSLTMILHTLMDWTPVKSLTNLLVTPCLMPMEISMSASLPISTSSWMHLQKIVGHTQKSLLFSQPISIRVHPKSLTGMPYAHSLHGHPHPASRTLSMSPPCMGLLHIPRITSKSTLSLAILFSTSPDAVKLLQQTPSSLTLLLLMMVPPWPNSTVAVILLSVMSMASNQPNNSSTLFLTTSENGEPWISSSVMEANMKSLSESLISSSPYSSKIISLNLIINTKIRLKIVLDLPSVTPTLSWTPLVALLSVGSSVCSTSVLYSTTWHLLLFKASALFKLCKELLQMSVSCSTSHFMNLFTTGLILLNLISTFLHHPMKRKVIGLLFADNQGDSLTWRILTEDTQKIIICSGV